jgi:hypothetical protein
MIAVNDKTADIDSTWQTGFLEILPEIQSRLRCAFYHLDPEAREDSIEEGVVNCLLAYARLHERGRSDAASASSLAWYATLQVKSGRPAAGRLNGKEPLSRYGQIHNDIKVERMDGNWIDMLVDDKRAPVADQVATKLDVRAWLATLTRRMRQIAKDLAFGCSTSEVAQKYGVTASRISQLRRSLEASWAAFQEGAEPAMA